MTFHDHPSMYHAGAPIGSTAHPALPVYRICTCCNGRKLSATCALATHCLLRWQFCTVNGCAHGCIFHPCSWPAIPPRVSMHDALQDCIPPKQLLNIACWLISTNLHALTQSWQGDTWHAAGWNSCIRSLPNPTLQGLVQNHITARSHHTSKTRSGDSTSRSR